MGIGIPNICMYEHYLISDFYDRNFYNLYNKDMPGEGFVKTLTFFQKENQKLYISGFQTLLT